MFADNVPTLELNNVTSPAIDQQQPLAMDRS
jgi:hypothetical protein